MIRNQKHSWFRQAILGLPVLLFATLGQANIVEPATETLTLTGSVQSARMGVAYIPGIDRYYAASGGISDGRPIYVYDSAGTQLSNLNPGIDNRGIYYNPNTSLLESVSWNASGGILANQGVMSINLDPAGDLEGTYTQLLAAPISALGSSQTMPSYDPFSDLLYAKNGGNVDVVQRTDGILSTTITLDLVTAGVVAGNLNTNFIGFTGVAGHELAVLDTTNKQVLIFDVNGDYVGASTLPIDLDVSAASNYATGYANNQFFIFDATVDGYRGFKVVSVATETLTLKGSVVSNGTSIAYIPGVDRYYAGRAGSGSYPAYAYDNAGTRLNSIPTGISMRGLYYNPNTSLLEAVSFNASGGSSVINGIMSLELDAAGDLTGVNTPLVAAPIPALVSAQTMPSYDPANDLLYAKIAGTDTVQVVQRSNVDFATTITLDLATAGVISTDLNSHFIGFTGVVNQELVVLDKTNRRVLIFDLSGAYINERSLPSDLDVAGASSFGTGYAYGQFFIYDVTAEGYRGFKVVSSSAPDIEVGDSLAPANDLQMAFGNVLPGSSSSQAIITLTNHGFLTLTISNAFLSGVDASQFSFDFTAGTSPCSGLVIVLSSEQSCTLGLTFAPQSDGAKSAALDITSNDPDEANVSIALSGSGVTPAPAASGGGGGGCTINSQAPFDPLLPLLVILGSIYIWRQKRELKA